MGSSRETLAILRALLRLLAIYDGDARALLDKGPLIAGSQVIAVVCISIAVNHFAVRCDPLHAREIHYRLAIVWIICEHCISLGKILSLGE